MNRSVHLTLALVIGVATLLLSTLIAWFSYQQRYAQVMQTGERTVLELMQTVQKSAQIAAYTGNAQIASDVVGSLMLSEMVGGVRLSGEHGLRSEQGQMQAPWLTHTLHAPFNPALVVGQLRVMPNYPALEASARYDAKMSALWLFALTVTIGLVVYITVFLLLSRPLILLSRQVHEILPGSAERLPLGKAAPRNELYRLRQDINDLLGTIEMVVSGERNLRTHIAELEYQLRGMFERASVGIFLINRTGQIQTSNPAFADMVCHLASHANWIDLLFDQPERFHSMMHRAAALGQAQMQDMQLAAPRQEQWRHVVLTCSESEQGEPCFQGLIYDITERKQGEMLMRRQADFDHLTGIYNRHAVEVLLPRLLQQQTMGMGHVAVMMMDLDRFKHINDTWGHDAGDQVLMEVSRRLQMFCTNGSMLARLGGDEFLLVLESNGDHAALASLARRIIHEVGQWVSIGQQQRDYVGCSIGIALLPEHGRRADELRNAADRAMYEVKRHGRQGYCFYQPDESLARVVHVEVTRGP